VKNFKIDALDARLDGLSFFGAARNPTHLIRRLKRLMPRALRRGVLDARR
jgi:hypothetical protein